MAHKHELKSPFQCRQRPTLIIKPYSLLNNSIIDISVLLFNLSILLDKNLLRSLLVFFGKIFKGWVSWFKNSFMLLSIIILYLPSISLARLDSAGCILRSSLLMGTQFMNVISGLSFPAKGAMSVGKRGLIRQGKGQLCSVKDKMRD